MAGVYSCKSGPSKEELAAQEQARIDSIKQATADSIRLADSLAKVKADSIAKVKADSIQKAHKGIFDGAGGLNDGKWKLTLSYGGGYDDFLVSIKNGKTTASLLTEYTQAHDVDQFVINSKTKAITIFYVTGGTATENHTVSLDATDDYGTNFYGNLKLDYYWNDVEGHDNYACKAKVKKL